MPFPPRPAVGATTKEENFDVFEVWADEVETQLSAATGTLAPSKKPVLDELVGGSRRARIALTLPGNSATVDSRTNVAARLPVSLPADSLRWRIHMRNTNYRDSAGFGALHMTGFWWGRNTTDAAGEVTGVWAAAPTQVAAAFDTAAPSIEYISPWITEKSLQIQAGAEHMLGFGYTCDPQNNHLGYGGGWTGNDSTKAADIATALTQSPTIPLDIWLEVEVSADVAIWCVLGDSIAAGTGAKFPIRESTYQKLAIAHGAMPMLFAHHGSTMQAWNQPTAGKWTTWLGSVSKPDIVLWQVGSNDVFNGDTLATCQSRFNALLPLVRSKLSSNISLVTLTPRNASATSPDKEAVRVAYNDWLFTLPGGAKIVYDVSERVESRTTPGTMDARFMSSDNVHPNTAGYARAVTAFGSVAAVPARAVDPRAPLHALPVAGAMYRWVSGRLFGMNGDLVETFPEMESGVDNNSAWNRPAIAEADGRRVLRFSGDQGLSYPLTRPAVHTIIAVCKVNAVPAQTGIIVGGALSSPNRGSLFVSSDGVLALNAGTTLTTPENVPIGELAVFVGVLNGAASIVGINGSETTGNAGAEVPNVTALGRYSGTNTSLTGDILEVVVYPRVLTLAERNSIRAVLNAVHNITA